MKGCCVLMLSRKDTRDNVYIYWNKDLDTCKKLYLVCKMLKYIIKQEALHRPLLGNRDATIYSESGESWVILFLFCFKIRGMNKIWFLILNFYPELLQIVGGSVCVVQNLVFGIRPEFQFQLSYIYKCRTISKSLYPPGSVLSSVKND